MAHITECVSCGTYVCNSTYCNDCAHMIAENPSMSKEEVKERVFNQRQAGFTMKAFNLINRIDKKEDNQ